MVDLAKRSGIMETPSEKDVQQLMVSNHVQHQLLILLDIVNQEFPKYIHIVSILGNFAVKGKKMLNFPRIPMNKLKNNKP